MSVTDIKWRTVAVAACLIRILGQLPTRCPFPVRHHDFVLRAFILLSTIEVIASSKCIAHLAGLIPGLRPHAAEIEPKPIRTRAALDPVRPREPVGFGIPVPIGGARCPS